MTGQNVTLTTSGGTAHLATTERMRGEVFAWPWCRSYGGTPAERVAYRHTALEVTCTECTAEVRRRQIAAARQAERAEPTPAPATRRAPAKRHAIASAAVAARYAEAVKLGTLWISPTGTSAELVIDFPDVASHGRGRRAAAETLAHQFSVRAVRPRIMVDEYAGRHPYGAQPWEYGARNLTVTGTPSNVARFALALPGILADLEALATRAAKDYGRFLRTAAVVRLEMMPSEHRQALRGWRREVFDELAYRAAYRTAGKTYSPEVTMSNQARAYAYTLPTLPDLYGYADEAEVAAMVADARHETAPSIVEPCPILAQAERAAALFDALDYRPDPFAPVDEAADTYELGDAYELDELEAPAAEVDAAAAVLAAAAEVVDAVAADLTTTTREAITRDANPARPARRPRRAAHLARGDRRPVAGRSDRRAPGGGAVPVLRGPARRAGGAGAVDGPRLGRRPARAGGAARALGHGRGGVHGAHPGALLDAAVRAGGRDRGAVLLVV